jgi:dTDP-4-dehydrorhamnose reductase
MKKYKFLIIGSNGLLGSNIVKILKQKKLSYFTVARNKSDYNLNLNNYENLNKIFLKYKFDNVINCAAIIDINYCEKMYKKISVINCDLVKYLAKMSKKYKFKFVQISTDHVYKRNGIGKNKENNKIFAINNYAKSKLLAERYLNKLNNYLIIRTNFSGRKKGAFIDWLMINIKKKKNIQLFNDMYTSTIDVKSCAKIIVELTALK